MEPKTKISKNLKFEQGLTKLEEMIDKLESGQLSLDDSVKFFEEGMELIQFCEARLNEAEAKVEALVKDNQGKITLQKVSLKNDTNPPEEE